MKAQVTLFEHVGCGHSHFTFGGIRRCKNRDGGRWVQDYEVQQATYYLLTPEEVETIQALREGTAKCIPVSTAKESTGPRSTATETTPGT